MWKSIRANPMHTAVGLALIGIGIFLIGHDQYFRWPPHSWLIVLANDNVTGFIYAAVGAAFLIWTASGGTSVYWNRIIIMVATFLFGALSVYEFFHWVGLGWDSMPWISNALNTAFVIFLARKSDTERHGGGKD
jgi:uncharacterized membrane protein